MNAKIQHFQKSRGFFGLTSSLTALVMLLFLVPQAFGQCVRPEQRITILMFQYDGTTAPRTKELFSNFRGAIKKSIEKFVEQIADNLNSADLMAFSLKPNSNIDPEPEPSNYLETYKIWCESLSLQLLRGNIVIEDPKVVVQSRVFVGDLGKNIKKSSIDLDLPFNLDGYKVLSDTHQFLMIYTIAIDYAKRNQDESTIIALLEAAAAKFEDIKARSSVYLDLVPLAKSIDLELLKYKNRGQAAR